MIPADFGVFEQPMQTEEAAEAMKHDGGLPETLLILSGHVSLTR